MQDYKKSNLLLTLQRDVVGLKQAISAYNKNKTMEYRNKVYSTLPKGPLLVAVESVPQGYSLNQSPNGEHVFNMSAIKTADGSLILAVFTDEKSVADYGPGHYLSMEPRGLFEIVQHQYNGGIVINPADQGFYINQNDVIKILKNWDKWADQKDGEGKYKKNSIISIILSEICRLRRRPAKIRKICESRQLDKQETGCRLRRRSVKIKK